jgi:hypothetical protein
MSGGGGCFEFSPPQGGKKVFASKKRNFAMSESRDWKSRGREKISNTYV